MSDTASRTPCTVAALAQAKRLDPDFLERLGLREVDADQARALDVAIDERGVFIPYPSLNGKQTRSRIRQFTETSHPSKWANDGEALGVYFCATETLEKARELGALVIVEGESDCWTLWAHGVPAFGVPGSSMTQYLEREQVGGIPRAYVIREPDEAGAKFPAAVALRLHEIGWTGELLVVDLHALHGVKDPSALHVDDPEQFAERWQTAIEAARPSDELTIVRLAGLPPLDYGRARKEAAAKLGVSQSILDQAVKDARKKTRTVPAEPPAQNARNQKNPDGLTNDSVQTPLHENVPAVHEEPLEPPDLAREPDILGALVTNLRAAGIVGEGVVVAILALAIVSRYFERPISVAVKGASSAGKSFVTETVLETFPPEAYCVLTGMSERNLIYDEEPLQHKMLVIYEAHGFGGETLSYLIRSLLSEGRLRYKTTEKEDGKFRSRTIEREGPTGLITTTTAPSLHPENETRLLSLSINETPAQTKAVMHALARGDEAPQADFSRWHQLHRWLNSQQHVVAVLFGPALAELIPPVAIRLRRDFSTILGLIRAHALLHQARRERDAQGRIVATIEDDYAPVRALVADLLAEGTGKRVPKAVRTAVKAVALLLGGSGHTTNIHAIARQLNRDRSVVSRHVRRAIEIGFLRNLGSERSRGGALVIGLGEPLPDDADSGVLPTAEQLAQEVARRGPEAAVGDSVQDGLHEDNPAKSGFLGFRATCAVDSGEEPLLFASRGVGTETRDPAAGLPADEEIIK